MSDAGLGQSDWRAIRWPLPLSRDLVHIVRIKFDLPVEQWTQLTALLTDEEKQRAARFRFDLPRQRFVICRATLRQVLGNCCGVVAEDVPLNYGPHGKPELAWDRLSADVPRVQFSVSHSGDYGLIAVTIETEVGVDIEECNPAVKTLKLAERFFSPVEASELANLPAERQLDGFYRGWTSKEAYLKATGRGLTLSLSSFCVRIDPDQPAALVHIDDQPDESPCWTTYSFDVGPGYAAATMVKCQGSHIALWDWQH